jgi:hypothetical protein
MKMRSLIFGLAMFVCMALIFNGCEQEADDDGGGETSVDISKLFALRNGESAPTNAAADTSGLKIASVRKSSSGDVTIVLTGAIRPDYQAVVTAGASGAKSSVALGSKLSDTTTDWKSVWGDGNFLAGAEPGIYGATYILGLIPYDIDDVAPVAIRQTNEALRLYKGATETHVSPDAKPTKPTIPHAGNIWIPGTDVTDTPVKWKVYVDGNDITKPNQKAEPFGVLLWNGGSGTTKYPSKIATLEIAKATISGTGATATATVGETLARYIIDYSGVTFPTAADLAAALGTGAAVDGTDKNTVNLTADVEIGTGKTVTVADGITLSVPANKKLTIANGATLTVTGVLNVAANANVEVASGGVFTVEDGASGDLEGTITIKSGGTSYDLSPGGASLWDTSGGSSGTYVFEAGAKAYVDGKAAGNLRIGGPNDSDTGTVIKLTSGTLTGSIDGYELDGNATVRGTYGLPGTAEFKIKAGGKLTVDLKWTDDPDSERFRLALYGTSKISGEEASGSGDTAKAASVIEIKKISDDSDTTGHGNIMIIASNTTGLNFYDSSGSQIKATVTTNDTIIPVGVYNWDAAADGSSTAGWKAEATTP